MAGAVALGLGLSAVQWVGRHRGTTTTKDHSAESSPHRGSSDDANTLNPPSPAPAQSGRSGEAAAPPRPSLADKPLLGLFDDTTEMGCGLNARRCDQLREWVAGCDAKDIAKCRQVAENLLDVVPLDPTFALAFLRKACDLGDRDGCILVRDFNRRRDALAAGSPRKDALERCSGGDGLACLALRSSRYAISNDQVREAEAKAFCEMGWASQCPTTNASDEELRSRFTASCEMDLADGCHLLGLFHRERGEQDAAMQAFTRGCELEPGHRACSEAADQP